MRSSSAGPRRRSRAGRRSRPGSRSPPVIVGDGRQRVLVDPAPEPAAAATAEPAAAEPAAAAWPGSRPMNCWRAVRVELAAVRRPEADRVDAQPAVGRLLAAASSGSGPALLAPSVSSDDDVRRVGARRRPAAARRPGRPSMAARRDVRVDLGDRVDRGEDPAADRRPAAGRQAPERVEQRPAGRWSAPGRSAAKPLNATIPIWVLEPWLLDERGRRGLGGLRAGSGRCRSSTCCRETSMARMIVVWFGGHAGDRDRPGDARAPGRERDGEQRERQVAAQRDEPRQGRVDQRQARVADAASAGAGAGSRCRRRRAAARAGAGAARPGHRKVIRQPSRARRATRRAADQQQREADAGEERGDLDRPRRVTTSARVEVGRRSRASVGGVRRPRSRCPPVMSAICWSVASSSWVWTWKPSRSSVAPAALPIPTVYDPDARGRRRSGRPRPGRAARCSRRRSAGR